MTLHSLVARSPLATARRSGRRSTGFSGRGRAVGCGDWPPRRHQATARTLPLDKSARGALRLRARSAPPRGAIHGKYCLRTVFLCSVFLRLFTVFCVGQERFEGRMRRCICIAHDAKSSSALGCAPHCVSRIRIRTADFGVRTVLRITYSVLSDPVEASFGAQTVLRITHCVSDD